MAALPACPVAPDHDLGAGGHRGLELVADLLPLTAGDHGPDVRVRLERVAHAKAPGVFDERLQVVVVDVGHHVEALGGGADLAGVEERGPCPSFGGDVDPLGDVRAHDEGILAAHLQVDPRDPLGAGGGDALSGGHRPREGDAVHALIPDDSLPDVPRAGEQVHHAGREVLEARRQRQGGQRCQLGRLAHRRIAAGQRRRELPRQEQERIVPGDDAGDHADGLLHHQRHLSRLDRGMTRPAESRPISA